MRARDAGIEIGSGAPGPLNAITDVPGVLVGHSTIVEGAARTGVTVVVPHAGIWSRPVFAAPHRLNGNGELTGLEWVRESGTLTTPVALTNTHSVGVVRDALVAEHVRARPGEAFWSLPVVGETWDGVLSDVNGQHVGASHLREALAGARGGRVPEGAVGGGTGMVCHGFKGGIGTASRVVGDWTVGVLVQANHGRRERLCVNGVPVGRALPEAELPPPEPPAGAAPGAGSIIALVATDAPLLAHQCARLAQRAGLGVARTGGVGEHGSGDLFLAFATGNRGLHADRVGVPGPRLVELAMLADEHLTPFFDAVVEATEESIVNALVAAETMTGGTGAVAHALDGRRLAELLACHG